MKPDGKHGNIVLGAYELVNYASMPGWLSAKVRETRNMPEIRCRMVNTGEISREDHDRFVRSLASRDDADYYAVMHRGDFIGCVNLHYTSPEEAERGIYLHPSWMGQGHSSRLLRLLYRYLGDDGINAVMTRVKVDNEPSNGLERHLGATLTGTDGEYNYYRTQVGRRRVVLRADAGKSTGYGHFIRTLALAGYLTDDFDCVMASYAPSEYQRTEAAGVCPMMEIEGVTREDADVHFLMQLRPSDIVVLDNYFFTTEYQQAVKDRGCALVCIDDIHSRHFVSDVVFTPGPCPAEVFSMEPSTRFYGGMEWSFLRSPFIDGVKPRGERDGIRRVVMAVGGADPFNLTGKLCGLLSGLLPEAHIDVIAGDTIEMPEGQSEGRVAVHRRVSAPEMVDLFSRADVGVFPASTICIEAMATGLPVVAGWYVDNQAEFYEYLCAKRAVAPVGSFLAADEDLRVELSRALQNAMSITAPTMDFAARRADIVKIFKSIEW